MESKVDLAQIKHDMENGIMVCRETFRKAIDLALDLEETVVSLQEQNEDLWVRIEALDV